MNDPTVIKAELARRELCRRRLLPFVERFGPANYQTGWFSRELSSAIEEFERAIVAQEAPRLMIFAPPRHGKTEIVSKAAPAWLLGRHPEWEGIVASYGDDLAIDNGGWAKDAVQSARYKEIFPKLSIRADTASKARIETTEGGCLRFTSIGGTIVGRGMHFGVLDDPIKNREEASSEAYRNKIRAFYTGPFLSRLAPGAGILLMHQRWDEEDLAGWLLSQPNNRFKVLNFPAIAEEDGQFRKKGEALHPERWPVAELMRKKEEMSTQDWLSMYQQRPTNPTGSFFKINLINWMARSSMPRLVKVYQAWDLALSPKQEADDSCGACMGVDHLGRFWLIDMVYGKWSPDETARQIIKFWLKHDAQMVWFENGPPYLGIMPSLTHEMKRQGTWIPNDEISHGGKSKDHRASAMRGLINGGNLYAPADAPWRRRFEEQAAAFPGGKNDDMIDPVAYLGIKSTFMMANPDTTPLPKQPIAVERSQMVKRNYAAMTKARTAPKASSRDDW